MDPFGRLGSLFQQARQRVSSLFQQPQRLNVPSNLVSGPPTFAQQALAQQPRGIIGSAQVRQPTSQAVAPSRQVSPPVPAPPPGPGPSLPPPGPGLVGGGGGPPTTGTTGIITPPGTTENIPSPLNLEPLFQSIENDLATQERAAQSIFEAATGPSGAIETGKAEKLGQANISRQQQLAQAGLAQAGQERRTESAVSEARRGFSELERGLISRFGTGVSTGLGATAILGGQTIQAIANLRGGLNEIIGNIDVARQGINSSIDQELKNADLEARNAKVQAKAQLDQRLGEVSRLRGEMAFRKAQLTIQEIHNYRDNIAKINAANINFQQQVQLEQQRSENRLQIARERTNALLQAANTRGGGGLSASGLAALVNANVITAAQARQGLPAELIGTQTLGTTTGGIPSDADKRRQLIAQGMDPDTIDLATSSIFNQRQF